MGEYQGSFATVKVNKNKTHAIKSTKVYDDDGCLDLCSVTDAAISVFVSATNCLSLPRLREVSLDLPNNTMTISMPYYGESLQKWIQKTLQADRLQMMPNLILQLIDACSALLIHDIQHTDIKPSNILIKSHRLTLIDFNIYSTKAGARWIDSVGTWCYVAPEILHRSTPEETSMVWSIGVLIAEMCDGYPLGRLESLVKDVNDRKQWQRLFLKKQREYSTGLPLTARHLTTMPSSYVSAFNSCTRWNHKQRCTLAQLRTIITETWNLSFMTYPPQQNIVFIDVVPCTSADRTKHIDRMHSLCNSDDGLRHLFYRSIWIYDRAQFDSPTDLDIVTFISIAYIVCGYSIEKTFLQHVHSVFDKTLRYEDIEPNVIKFMKILKWNVFDKAADMIALEQGATDIQVFTYLPDVMKCMGNAASYNGQSVSSELLKAIAVQKLKNANPT